jgi:hypothetical protein
MIVAADRVVVFFDDAGYRTLSTDILDDHPELMR